MSYKPKILGVSEGGTGVSSLSNQSGSLVNILGSTFGTLATANNGVLSTNSSGVASIDTTNFQVLSTGLQLKGNNSNTSPPAGFIGENIRTTIAQASAVTVSNNTVTNIMSIELTSGIWDVSCLCQITGFTTGTAVRVSISTTSLTEGTAGDNMITWPLSSTSNGDAGFTIPAYRLTLGATTTVYMVVVFSYTVGTAKAYGRLRATRTG